MKCTPHPEVPSYESVRAAVERLEPTTTPRWGKMNVLQMMAHCSRLNRLYLGEEPVAWWVKPITRLFKGFLLRRFLETSPFEFARGVRTLPSLQVEAGDVRDSEFDRERAGLIASLERAHTISGYWDHPLYGSIDAEVGRALVRTHTTHHLNQFGVIAP